MPGLDQIGPFRIEAELGRGGMGIVYLAHQEGLNRKVALKVLEPSLAGDAEFVERFRNEASTLARLDSPHVIAVHDHGKVGDTLYIATQHVTGGDLGEYVKKHGALAPARALVVFEQLVEALRDAHAVGIVHRDVKPSNVLLRGDRAEPYLYLCDFGLAQAVAEDGLTRTGMVAGSLAYMAPERHEGRQATMNSDLYSAGCVLWVLLTGQTPYGGTDFQQAMSHTRSPVPQLHGDDPVTSELNHLVAWCMAKNPAGRPRDAQQLLDRVKAAQPLMATVGDKTRVKPTTSSPTTKLPLIGPPPPSPSPPQSFPPPQPAVAASLGQTSLRPWSLPGSAPMPPPPPLAVSGAVAGMTQTTLGPMPLPPPPPPPPPSKRKSSHAALFVTIGVVVVALAVGAAFGVPAIMRTLGSGTPASAPAGPSQGQSAGEAPKALRVSGVAPTGTAGGPAPAGVPVCPSGMVAISWTRYADGSVLVCEGGSSSYAVVTAMGWTPTELAFTANGFDVVFGDSATLSAGLGGSFVLVTQGGLPKAYVASEAWSRGSGTFTFANAPADIASCPGESPISLSTWNTGWLLVCGTSASDPTFLAYVDAGGQGATSTGMSFDGTSYCGDVAAGKACVRRMPPEAQLGGSAAHCVTDNYFAGFGHGGGGCAGPSEVPPQEPQETAKAQVLRLVGILNKSKGDRDWVGRVVTKLKNCRTDAPTSRELDQIASELVQITRSRESLIDELDSAPVDLVPDGRGIVAKLRKAFEASRDADEGWAEYARSQSRYGCSPAGAWKTEATRANEAQSRVSPAKDAFVAAWKKVASTYKVKAFTRDDF